MLPKRKIIEVFEELSPQDNGYWEVPDGVYEVEFALVAGGLNGESSDIYIMPGVAVTEVVYRLGLYP